MSKSKRFVITTSGERSLAKVENDLKKTGFQVNEKLDAIGIIIGSASDDSVEDLRKIAGVADVSEDPPPINIGPPDADIM